MARIYQLVSLLFFRPGACLLLAVLLIRCSLVTPNHEFPKKVPHSYRPVSSYDNSVTVYRIPAEPVSAQRCSARLHVPARATVSIRSISLLKRCFPAENTFFRKGIFNPIYGAILKSDKEIPAFMRRGCCAVTYHTRSARNKMCHISTDGAFSAGVVM